LLTLLKKLNRKKNLPNKILRAKLGVRKGEDYVCFQNSTFLASSGFM
jgi:hypothetical protein